MERFGKEHWDTLKRIEILCVEYGGELPLRYRCHEIRHLDDLKATGLVESSIGEIPRVLEEPDFRLTRKGWEVASELRRHLIDGGTLQDFVPTALSEQSVTRRAMRWVLGKWTNTPSKSIWAVMMGLVEKNTFCDGKAYDVPYNAPEMNACCSLLITIPEWKERLPELVAALPKWKPFVDNWDRIEEIYLDLSRSSDMFPLVWDLKKEGEGWEKKTLVDVAAAEHREGPTF